MKTLVFYCWLAVEYFILFSLSFWIQIKEEVGKLIELKKKIDNESAQGNHKFVLKTPKVWRLTEYLETSDCLHSWERRLRFNRGNSTLMIQHYKDLTLWLAFSLIKPVTPTQVLMEFPHLIFLRVKQVGEHVSKHTQKSPLPPHVASHGRWFPHMLVCSPAVFSGKSQTHDCYWWCLGE